MTDNQRDFCIFLLAIFLTLSMALHVVTIRTFGADILTNMRTAWCGIDIAMKEKTHPSECKGVMP